MRLRGQLLTADGWLLNAATAIVDHGCHCSSTPTFEWDRFVNILALEEVVKKEVDMSPSFDNSVKN